MDQLLSSKEVEVLEISIEEATRSTDEGIKRFIEPAKGTLSRALTTTHVSATSHESPITSHNAYFDSVC
jgi:hypothetical protein